MQLTVDAIKDSGFAGGLVEKTIEWVNPQGDELSAQTWIRPMSYHTSVNDAKAFQEGSSYLATRIARHVCMEDGSPVFRVEDITGIDAEGNPIMVKKDGKKVERGGICKSLNDALLSAINEVSGLGKKKG